MKYLVHIICNKEGHLQMHGRLFVEVEGLLDEDKIRNLEGRFATEIEAEEVQIASFTKIEDWGIL